MTRHPDGAPPAVRRALGALFDGAIAALAPDRLLRTLGARVRLGPRMLVIGAGKGAGGLALAAERRLGRTIVDGIVIVPASDRSPLRRIDRVPGGHPLPDGRSTRATARLLATVRRHPGVPVLVLVTGGASSLLAAPAPGLRLADKRRTTALLLGSGAPIHAMNVVRKHLSAVKGGRLAEHLEGRRVLTLVVSDVPDDDCAVVGSGPTLPDPSTFADARRVLARHRLLGRVPGAVRRHLRDGGAGRIAETPKSGSALFRLMDVRLLAGNATACGGAAAAARRAGYREVIVVRDPTTGSTAAAARALAARIRRCRARARGTLPTVLIAGGETTVRLGRRAGRGGRNQELALAVARALAGLPGWALLSGGSDGVDGPTDAAGAFVDGATIASAAGAGARGGRGGRARHAPPGRVRSRTSVVDDALARHDVYPLLAAVDALFRPGPTGTNVADLQIALVWRDRGWRLPRRV